MTRLGILLFFTALVLSFVGVFILYETSTYNAQLQIGDEYYFVKNQLLYVFIGIILSIIISRLPYKLFSKHAVPLLIISLCLLVLVFLPGIGLHLKGANRWINLGFITIQPSEILKITLMLYLAAWLSNKEKGRLLAFLILIGLAVGLVLIEPDMGTSMIIGASAIVVYFLSGAPFKDMVFIFVSFIVAAALLVTIEPYRVLRLAEFRNFNAENIEDNPYHLKQIVIALGSGGLTGVGLGNSIQKYAYLPESTTDSIFAIYAEETGFLGSMVLMSGFLFFLLCGYSVSARAPDQFSRLFSAGIVTYIGLQALVNLASQSILIPLTGIPLPFISYGGSSMLINFTALGILLSITRNIKRRT